jgi:CDP-diacylglycerol---serine O-phosphatidyltransferase
MAGIVKKNIPNAITCCNLLCGCLAIVKIFEGNLVVASYLVGLAAIFDFFDGFAARLLKVSSPIGKDLDSLADMVTFGVVPGIMMFNFIKLSLDMDAKGFEIIELNPIFCNVAFIIPIFSAIRLAKFNNDTRQSESFIGLPTPANAILICSLPLILQANSQQFIPLYNPYTLCFLCCILSILLIAELPLFALKFKHFNWKGNEIRYSFLGFSLVLIIVLKLIAIPLIIIFYIVFSLS